MRDLNRQGDVEVFGFLAFLLIVCFCASDARAWDKVKLRGVESLKYGEHLEIVNDAGTVIGRIENKVAPKKGAEYRAEVSGLMGQRIEGVCGGLVCKGSPMPIGAAPIPGIGGMPQNMDAIGGFRSLPPVRRQ